MEAVKLMLVLVIILLSAGLSHCQNNQDNSSGTFFPQKPPDLTPEIFASGIISTGLNENVITFMPGRNECCWSVSIFGLETILTSKLVNGKWTKPINLGNKINSSGSELFPIVSGDGKYLFFGSGRSSYGGKCWVSATFIEELRPN